MVLHLDEFQKQDAVLGKYLNYYDKLPEYLHEMSVDDIMKHINRNGVRSWYLQQRAVLEYFMWLHKNYGIDLVEKFYEFKQICKEKSYVGFFDLEELKKGITQALVKAESENSTTFPDYSGLKAIFFLEWYGVLPESAVTIQLTDVSDDGKKVYVPAENRTIEITDNEVADYFAEYKKKTGFTRSSRSKAETPYTQKSFYRNTSRRVGAINVKTIYNVKLKFLQSSEDVRFEKKRVYYAGRYYAMLQAEQQLGREFSSADEESCKIMRDILGKDVTINIIFNTLREYRVYKEEYINRM